MTSSSGSSPSSSNIPTQKTEPKPCQKSCRGVMLYFPPAPGHNASASSEGSSSWRSKEPFCLGLSTERKGPALDLEGLHEARAIPAGQSVDYSVVLGHAVFQPSSSNAQALPPGCAAGVEVMSFSNTHSRAIQNAQRQQDGRRPSTVLSSLATSLASYASSFRILSSDDSSNGSTRQSSNSDTSSSLSRTWESVLAFDPQQYATKFSAAANKNVDAMSKWLRDLQDAVSKPKA